MFLKPQIKEFSQKMNINVEALKLALDERLLFKDTVQMFVEVPWLSLPRLKQSEENVRCRRLKFNRRVFLDRL